MTSRCSLWPVNFVPVSLMGLIFTLCPYWTWRYILTRCPVTVETIGHRDPSKAVCLSGLLFCPWVFAAPKLCPSEHASSPVLLCARWAACDNRALRFGVSGVFPDFPVVVVTCTGRSGGARGATKGPNPAAPLGWLFRFLKGVPEPPCLAFSGPLLHVPPECTTFSLAF